MYYNMSPTTAETYDNKDVLEVNVKKPRGRPPDQSLEGSSHRKVPQKPYPIIPPRLKKPTENNVADYKDQMVQDEKDKYKKEIRIYMKERLKQTAQTIKLDSSIKKLEDKLNVI